MTCKQVDAWLGKNGHPRLPLPAICGYIPMARYLYTGLGGDAHRRKVVKPKAKKPVFIDLVDR